MESQMEPYHCLTAAELLARLQRSEVTAVDCDLILCPTAPVRPFAVNREVPEGWPHSRWTSWELFTWPWNMSGQPAISVPCGFTNDGLPIGAQIIGARHFDHLAQRAAQAFQQVLPLTDRQPPLLDIDTKA